MGEPDHETVMDGRIAWPTGCPRGRDDCQPLGRRASEGYESFICCGENDGTHPGPDQDRWRFCSKSEHGVDILVNLDRRDMVEWAAVLLEGLSSEANRMAGGADFVFEQPDGSAEG